MKLAAHARRAARMLRHLPDRVLHPVRRRRARRAAGDTRAIQSIVFVCHGNICRSPYAAASCTRTLAGAWQTDVHISSAGFIGPGREAPGEAQAAARTRGVDLAPHRSSLITQDQLGPFNLVVVMEPYQRDILLEHMWVRARIVVLGDFDPAPITTRAIPDPFGSSVSAFEACYERIDRCIADLLSTLPIPASSRQPV